ncbi:unnamed protein product [Gongylonema pulchrum]|uniref:DNA-directed DNA polymerase n=1 Tax=Gongylonema pulchrum TaxID=637853 RepID=A0A183DP25_9BILA|nr:unnamed protein product [Gongylonema pulchrum]
MEQSVVERKRPTDFDVEDVSLRRMVNAAYTKHVYPLIVPSDVGEIDVKQKLDAVDEIQLNMFRYRRMADMGYEALLTSPLSYLSKFTGLGQVKPKRHTEGLR